MKGKVIMGNSWTYDINAVPDKELLEYLELDANSKVSLIINGHGVKAYKEIKERVANISNRISNIG